MQFLYICYISKTVIQKCREAGTNVNWGSINLSLYYFMQPGKIAIIMPVIKSAIEPQWV